MVKYKVTADTNYKKEQRFKEILSFVIYSLAAPWPTFGHYWGDSCTHLMIIIPFIQVSTRRSLGVS